VCPSSNTLQSWDELDPPAYDIINACVQCGLCLSVCPTYLLTFKETSSPRGRIHLLKAVWEGKLDARDPILDHQMYECLDCRACETICPSGVRYGVLVESARAQLERKHPRSLWVRALRWIVFNKLFASMALFRAFSRALWLYQRIGLSRIARSTRILDILHLADKEALLPQIPSKFFVPEDQALPPKGNKRFRVGLFAGCIMSTAFAEIDRATIRVLQHNGCEVVVPKRQGCCGALNVHSGERRSATEMMKANIQAFERLDLDYIIVNSAGCGATLKEYPHFFKDDPGWHERAKHFSSLVRDVSEFLSEVGMSGPNRAVPVRVTYQDPCHLAHAQKVYRQPRELLASIPGVELVEMQESKLCCGSAGIYNITNPEISNQLLERKLEHALATGAEVIVSANPGCMLQLQKGLRHRGLDIQVKHLVQILDQAYGD